RNVTGVQTCALPIYVTMFNHFELDDSRLYEWLEQLELDHFKLDDYITSAEYLSLGEKKRMHLIRMFTEGKDTWILDEPTASLNVRLRDKIWAEIFKKETVITATHDLSHLESFDYVHYLERDRKSTRLNSSHVSISYAV